MYRHDMTKAASINPEALAKIVDDAVNKQIRSTKRTAILSVFVASLSLAGVALTGTLTYLGNIETAEIKSNTEQEIASIRRISERDIEEIKANIKRGDQNIGRAQTVAQHYENLLDREGEANKRLAFLNLWHLYTEIEDRNLLILTALQYAGDDVLDLMLALSTELEAHQELITTLTDRKSCLDTTVTRDSDCYVNESAKQLLSKIDSEKAIEILLKSMSAEALTSPNNANLDILRIMIQKDPQLIPKVSKLYKEKYTDVVGLSYLLYEYGDKTPFRSAINSELSLKNKRNLVEFISGWPLTELEHTDKNLLFEFLMPLLTEFDRQGDHLYLAPALTTLGKISSNLERSSIEKLEPKLVQMVRRSDLSWPIRSEAGEVLANSNVFELIKALKYSNIDGDSLLGESLAGFLVSSRPRISNEYPTNEPPTVMDFDAWLLWMENL